MENVFGLLREFHIPFIFATSQMSNMGLSPYGVLKKIGEHYTKSLGGLSVKFWNVFGVESDPSKYHVISDFMDMALNKGQILMKTDGREYRDFLYAVDCSRGLTTMMEIFEVLQPHNEIDLAQFEWTRILDIAKIIAEHYQVDYIPGEDRDEVQNDVRNEPRKVILDYWAPQYNLRQAISEVIDESHNKRLM